MRPEKRIRFLRWYLRIFGGITLLAFAAAAMPGSWMITIAEAFGIEGFPEHPLTWYLARHLSVLYGLLGVAVLHLASDLEKHRPLVYKVGWNIVVLGVLQGMIDLSTGMPPSWTWGEASSTIIGGAIIVYLARDQKDSER